MLYGNGSDYSSSNARYIPPIEVGNITDYGAYTEDVDSIFTWLADGNISEGIPQLTSEDNLFIWTFDHGGSSGNNNSTLGLMDGSITDTDFANLVDQIAYNHRVIWMQQCYAGGFIDNLENQNTVIVTGSRGDRLAYRADDYNPDGADQRENELFNGAYYHHGEFDYHMINASRMETIVGNSLSQADQDDNGLMSIAEIWAWESAKDSRSSLPQYSDPGNIGSTVYIDIPPSAPKNIGLAGWWGEHPTLYWDSNPEIDKASYEVYRRTRPYGGQWSSWAKKVETSDTMWTDYGFVLEKPGTGNVQYFVKAKDQSGQRSEASETVGTIGNSYGIGQLSMQDQQKKTSLLPAKYILAQNSPNPFNPVTTIRYQLPEVSNVTIQVFNVRGSHVITLRNSIQGAGYHQIQWNGLDKNGNHVSSGTYFYHLTARSQESAKAYQKTLKMLYVK